MVFPLHSLPQNFQHSAKFRIYKRRSGTQVYELETSYGNIFHGAHKMKREQYDEIGLVNHPTLKDSPLKDLKLCLFIFILLRNHDIGVGERKCVSHDF
jgi:hypothetical protein